MPLSTDITVMRLAITMTRDVRLSQFLGNRREVRDALLYAGLSSDIVREYDPQQLSSDPIVLADLLETLDQLALLVPFLAGVLRAAKPSNAREFHNHLQPLGLGYDLMTNQIRTTRSHTEAERTVRTELDQILVRIDPGFPERLRGAWEAYYSSNPDRYRQAVASAREAFNEILQRLGGSGTRRERVRRILQSESRTELVEAAANLVDRLYDLQSAQEHRDPDQPTALYVLVETEHVLYYVLSRLSQPS